MRTLDDVRTWLSLENTGTCETGAAPFWRLLAKYKPDLKVVTIRRPVEEVVESLVKVGVPAPSSDIRKIMIGLDHKLDQIEGRLQAYTVRFADLADEDVCGDLFEYCTPYKRDSGWWNVWSQVNVQINFQALRRYLLAHMPAINMLRAQARLAMLKDLAVKPVEMAGVVIKEEPFINWIRDCQELFQQHCSDIGEHPDNWKNKNLPLMGQMYDSGLLQVMVGRSNGRPFGYLVTMIVPSMELHDTQTSQHTAFYASPAFPGLGLKLQRAALASLKQKGVHETFMRAGIRGDGERMGSLYKRLGAQDFGKMYRVGLEN